MGKLKISTYTGTSPSRLAYTWAKMSAQVNWGKSFQVHSNVDKKSEDANWLEWKFYPVKLC